MKILEPFQGQERLLMKKNKKVKRKPSRKCLSIETNNHNQKVRISVLLAYYTKTRDFEDLFKLY